jgi:alkaline phosphatase
MMAASRRDRHGLRMLVAGFVLWAVVWPCLFVAPAASAAQAPAERSVKNVIVMISDGCGFRHVEAAGVYTYGVPGRCVYEAFPCRMAMKTDPLIWTAEGLAPGGYDPETALSTGRKTTDGAIGVDPEGTPLRHVLSRCEGLGMATGVVTTVPLSHATPAGFVAHNVSRYNCEEIAREMILDSPIDCIMGCGNPWYDNNGHRRAGAGSYAYVGGEPLWRALTAGQAGAWNAGRDDADGDGKPGAGEWVDADHNGLADDAWTLVQSREEFRRLTQGQAPKRLIGVPCVGSTLQCGRSGDANAAPYVVPFNEGVPTLAEMTQAALNVLDDDPDGLFLMVEGGAIDTASHSNLSGRMVEEECGFNDAVAAAVEWVEAHGNWDETVLIVTADHECGYLTAGEGVWSYEPLRGNGVGRLPEMAWNSGTHTNSLVPLYAKGAAAAGFADRVVGRDPHFGPYVDNTDVAKLLFRALGDPQD